jgi:hypothetical protein
MKTPGVWLAAVMMAVVLAVASGRAWDPASAVKVTEVVVNGRVFASFTAPGAFGEDLRKVLLSGLPVTFTYTVDLRRPSWFWPDPTLASTTVGGAATFDSLTGQYQVSRLQNGAVVKSDRLTQEADVRAALTAFDRVPLEPRQALEPNADYYLRVRLRTQPRLAFSLWPFGSDDGAGRKDFTFIR